ncbi:response regulator [Aeromonas diversa CDC 2478-85]|uniref:Response regulator n=1 Tax=Aeromonas diversa CDC 2478-85 TaxID=1268237 RepID=N9U297_9GAMM|nr:two-component system response regulator [Aeromonas diversa]ENY72499.1 response regulator [Aeromonas diversa CDC 2478-85]
MNETILVVDDNPENRAVLIGLLKSHYRVLVAVNGSQALEICHRSHPDLVLLDVMMPEIDGYEVCRRIKAHPDLAEIPVIFLTAKSQIEDEQMGFSVGAVDYIMKPISPPILLSRVKTHIRLRQAREALARQNEVLEQRVKARTHELEMLQDAIIVAMASLAETRDNETGNHIRRTQHYVRALANQLVSEGRYMDQLTPAVIELLFKSAPLHDVGKVGIPDQVLLKPGKLTEDEFEVMKSHTTQGLKALKAVEEALDFECAFLNLANEIAYSHQEKWDGSGYPEGLKGEAIPLSARLMSVADVYDALISKRVYKPPFSHEKAVSIIREGRGQHFDPVVVDAFLAIEGHFQEIARRFHDEECPLQDERPQVGLG